jgi:hypothetical protein
MINCIYAEWLSDTVTECRNSGKSHIKQAAQAYCYRCKHRLPVDNDLPPLVESMPHARQMRIEEWLKED